MYKRANRQNRKYFVAAYSMIVIGNTKRIKESNHKFMENNAYIQSYMKEIIDGIQAIKAVNAMEQVIEIQCVS